MSKFFTTLIALLYLGFTSGIVVNWHYCMGDLAAVEWGMDYGTSCSKCGMKDRKGCCETTYQVFKVNDAHLSAKSLVPALIPFETVLPTVTDISGHLAVGADQQQARFPSSPFRSGRYHYLRQRALLL
ncbi:MAG: HYC_CC_PP family protein [Chitinophagaceae bacterium]